MSEKIKIEKKEVLSNQWAVLNEITFRYLRNDGEWELQNREAYDRGNGACVLLYHSENRSVILTRQFRLPTYLNGNKDGLMIEACAGILENDCPETCIKREIEEETGYRISQVNKIFESYMSPGSLTEINHFFVAQYSSKMKKSKGGGLKEEQEDIEVLEMPFEKAYNMIASGEIKDAKTIMLLQHAKINQLV